MSDEETIDPKKLIKRLEPHQLGLFEPLSGLMLLNVSDARYQEAFQRWAANASTAEDVALIRTINHEMYHFAQVAASGYVFAQQRRAFEVFCSVEPLPDATADPEARQLLAGLREAAGANPELKARAERLIAVLAGRQTFALMEERAAPGDNSIFGALNPGFFKHLDALAEREGATHACGLSIRGVLEGSAVIHTNLLMHPVGDAGAQTEAELAMLPAVYSELYAYTRARVGGRTLELLLPTVAVALRYAEPQAAYSHLLGLVADSPPGGALERGRAIAAEPPALPEAGPVLGTASEVRRQHTGYAPYDPILKKLESGEGGVDSYSFLADPAAMHRVQTFPVGIITQDGYWGPLDKAELVARMLVMSGVLRVKSRRRVEREFLDFQLAVAHDALCRLIEPGGPG
jgi:hypothetical protein